MSSENESEKQDFSSVSASGLRLVRLGWRGALRIGKTLGVVYPKALACLVHWRAPGPIEVRESFEKLGVTYIKLGQLIASSPSIFPKDYVEAFQGCLDQTSPIPFARVREVIESDLGRKLEEVYRHIDPQPLASASIAQVHAATLLSGEDVVVKVQKPGVEDVLTADMNFLFVLSRLVEIASPGLSRESVSGIVSELYQSMLDECDFIKELRNLSEFNRFLQREGIADVAAPRAYLQASSRKVLTMERFYGIPLTDYENLDKYTSDPAMVLISGLNTWFASLTQCDFFHADLHSGNMMLLEDGRLGFIDFGLVGHIQPAIWKAMFSLMDGLSKQDYDEIARSMVTVGMTSQAVDTAALTRDIRNLFEKAADVDPLVMVDIDVGNGINELLMDLAELGKSYGIRFPRSFTLLLKQFLYFDRYVEMLVPNMDIFSDDRIQMLLE